MDPDQTLPRWHVEITALENGTPILYRSDFEEIEDMQEFVEEGPDWTLFGYCIVITYNLGKPAP